MRRNANRCPSCGERVSPFAAGCALCGADLDPQRHTPGKASVSVPQPWRGTGARLSPDLIAVAVIVLLTLFAPLIGAFICALRAYGEERGGRTRQRNIALALGVVCVLFLIFPLAQLDLLERIGLP